LSKLIVSWPLSCVTCLDLQHGEHHCKPRVGDMTNVLKH
jgi:hypothetical protein